MLGLPTDPPHQRPNTTRTARDLHHPRLHTYSAPQRTLMTLQLLDAASLATALTGTAIHMAATVVRTPTMPVPAQQSFRRAPLP